MRRPKPPAWLAETGPRAELGFAPAPGVWAWALEAFVDEGGPLYNEEHRHLARASVGVLWTNVANKRRGRRVLGTAEIPRPDGGVWAKARARFQLEQWFGEMPDFLVTLFAPWCASADNASFCCLLEHELLHCAQAKDAWGAPRYNKMTGKPVWALRGHDLQEFTSIVERYGADTAGEGVVDIVAAAKLKPLVAAAEIRAACGTGLRRVA